LLHPQPLLRAGPRPTVAPARVSGLLSGARRPASTYAPRRRARSAVRPGILLVLHRSGDARAWVLGYVPRTVIAHIPAKWSPVRRQEYAPGKNLELFRSAGTE